MENKTDPKRNVPSEEGRHSDPHMRDEDARQPGVSTISSAPNDEDNQHLTRTVSDGFREDGEGDDKADKSFDE